MNECLKCNSYPCKCPLSPTRPFGVAEFLLGAGFMFLLSSPDIRKKAAKAFDAMIQASNAEKEQKSLDAGSSPAKTVVHPSLDDCPPSDDDVIH